MTWDEWERSKANAARMSLNQLPAEGSGAAGGAGDLVVHDDTLGRLGELARSLRDRLGKDGDHARVATFDAAVSLSNDGLDMGGGLLEVHDAWSTKLATLREACGHISNHLDFSRSVHREDERKIELGLRSADGKPMTASRIRDQFN
ncbi:hypothetical protein [Streptomyces sp. CAU 1734]|uniref:hypothetical protein n=1 Tax=Streptomyces sp. CAU 1734 TaxID=3140360 RepID=UPI00326118B5